MAVGQSDGLVGTKSPAATPPEVGDAAVVSDDVVGEAALDDEVVGVAAFFVVEVEGSAPTLAMVAGAEAAEIGRAHV